MTDQELKDLVASLAINSAKTDQEIKDLVASLEANGAKMDARFEKEVKEREKANREWHAKFSEDMEKLRASNAEFRKNMEASNAEFRKNMEVSHAKFSEDMEKLRASQDQSQQELKDLKLYIEGVTKELRGLGVTQGDIAEEEFYQSLERHKKLGALHFDTIERKVQKNASSPEFDILLINGDSVGLIEVKANLRTYLKNKYYVKREGNRPKSFDMKRCIDDKVNDFRRSCPEYKDYKLYFGFGSLITDDKLIAQAKENGIFLLTQKGNHIELVNETVVAF